ncbi:hypothetical protein P3T35_001325 [Kitasatospora sp. GP30]|uniref:serine/threonine-protein kinase n=1 Tax=Kitasatospora sp. GP30 TaxID=3035084 RepID=UPI000CC809A3|nr:serine/threonine-protein kinase [Kitasatospora sp. GP30]MDH6139325.1 hypothetical protein [Kitasatospora sp. GP30]
MRVLADRYELVEFIGRGGMGEVWEGRDQVIGRSVAVKLLPKQESAGSVDLFFREARTAGGLNHRGVVTVHDIGQDKADGTLFLVMEMVTGGNLAARLRADGPPPVATALDWADQTAAALGAAHQAGVVHRDLKPANLMLTAVGEVKVLDFGIARYMESTNQSSQVMGTLSYMAPERFDGAPGDARCDLYALGCVLHEFLTGAPPFQETGPVAMMNAHLRRTPVAPSALRPEVPAALDALVLRLLAKDPADRPASAAEVQAELCRLAGAAAPGPAAPPPAAPAPVPGGPAAAPVVMAGIVSQPPAFALPGFPPPGFSPATVPLGAKNVAAPAHRGPRIAVAATGVLSLASLALPMESHQTVADSGLDILLGHLPLGTAQWSWLPTAVLAVLTVLALATAWPRRSRLGTGVCWAAIPVGLIATACLVALGGLATTMQDSFCHNMFSDETTTPTPVQLTLTRRCLDSAGLDFGFYVTTTATVLLVCAGLWAVVESLRHRRRLRTSLTP